MENVEELMTTTILIGQAIAAVQFPGMYRLYDFHSKKAPKLKNGQPFRPFFNQDSDDEGDGASENAPDPSDYSHFFNVKVGEDVIYIEDVLESNEAGWLPLHACCMSLQTVDAGCRIIDEMVKRGSHLDHKTAMGPGTFNRGWTALQMACAYGVEPLVEKLVEMGADVNAVNSFGYSCMLEACHRGYIVVAKTLLKGKVDLAYIPSEALASESPFSSAPCQSPLAEAARSGFFKVVQMLLDAGAPKDLPNRLGWTALHEACFYNRIETVKTLLLGGCNATLRTRQGALPYHLACIPDIKKMLETMGGAAAKPNPGDTIDMLQILTELTMPEDANIASAMSLLSTGNDDGIHKKEEEEDKSSDVIISGSKIMPSMKFEPAESKQSSNSEEGKRDNDDNDRNRDNDSKEDSVALSPTKEAVIRTTGGLTREEGEAGGVQSQLLHSGPLLGNLPAFGKKQASPTKFQREVDQALSDKPAPFRTGNPNALFGAAPGARPPSMRADGKSGGTKNKKHNNPADEVPKDTPPEFICQLTQRVMSDPMKTIYGNVYDRTAIVNWLNTQGKICPLTGAPLSESDLVPHEELNKAIKKWILQRSTGGAGAAASSSSGDVSAAAGEAAGLAGKERSSASANDDLYDF